MRLYYDCIFSPLARDGGRFDFILYTSAASIFYAYPLQRLASGKPDLRYSKYRDLPTVCVGVKAVVLSQLTILALHLDSGANRTK